MVAERITPAAVIAERDLLDGEERRILGEVVVGLAFTNATVKDLAPREMEEVAATLFALIDRAPFKTSHAYAPLRMVVGALASELRGFAHAAGEPVGLEADLRAAWSQKEERQVRQRLADQAAAWSREIDDVILAHHAMALYDGPAEPQHEEEPPDQATNPRESIESPDAPAYVL
jgi:hypothetical protein